VTEEASVRLRQSASQLQKEIERCEQEIAEIEALLGSGNPDVEGLCLALADWSAELRLLIQEKSAASRETGGAGPASTG
jgi:wobble nucleotide-excising tRNase